MDEELKMRTCCSQEGKFGERENQENNAVIVPTGGMEGKEKDSAYGAWGWVHGSAIYATDEWQMGKMEAQWYGKERRLRVGGIRGESGKQGGQSDVRGVHNLGVSQLGHECLRKS